MVRHISDIREMRWEI